MAISQFYPKFRFIDIRFRRGVQLGCTPLLLACEKGHMSVAHMLLERGARLEVADEVGEWVAAVSEGPRGRGVCSSV